jgi:hypothetical protein
MHAGNFKPYLIAVTAVLLACLLCQDSICPPTFLAKGQQATITTGVYATSAVQL